MNHCIVLFFQFCKFSVLCFGGGYMLIPLLTAEFVDREQVLTMSEFGNLLSVAQVTPGPVGLNTATYVGYVNAGFFGSLAASLGLVVPTILIGCSAAAGINRWKDTFLVKGMLKGTRLAAVALIMFAVTIFLGMSVFTRTIPWEALGALFKFELPVIPDDFRVSPAGVLICGVTIVLMLKTKLPTTALLLGSAAAGALLAAWF
ncbi:MAG: chromate transporter [Lentisphaeria bacterium]|jgi:chromate transporter|nr:chromate transporter [Lentisphaeria bacterium]